MKSTPLIRVRNQELSLWQSIVANQVLNSQREENSNKEINLSAIQDHPMINAVSNHALNAFTENHEQEEKLPLEIGSTLDNSSVNSYLSELCFNIAKAKVREDTALEATLMASYRKFSDRDPGFLSCATTYAAYNVKYHGVLKYNSWIEKGNINYGVINYKLPNNAKVGIIGDWGTGMEDAEYLLKAMLKTYNPDAIIHLGDIYYSGTPEECQDNYAKIITKAFNEHGKRLPVFTIPGNHDYYAFGYGYYDMVKEMNSFMPNAMQETSYFCLRTEDDGWQFLGMDTGFDDANPADQFNTYYAGPQLNDSEIGWHKDKLENFSGNTILLSHHQLFSNHAKINGSLSVYGSYPNLNKYLLDVFRPYLGTKVAAWFWGHEHNQVLYNDNLYGLPKGRLTGASAYEELSSSDPYSVKYPNVPFKDKYKLNRSNGYYNHGFAVIDLAERQNPTDKVKVKYYDYPSWGSTPPNPIPSNARLITEEEISTIPQVVGKPIHFGKEIFLNLEKGLDYVTKINKGIQYYPSIGQSPIKLKLLGGSGTVKNGALVQIQSLEPGLGAYNMLGAWKTPALYYYKKGWDQQNWFIKKVDNSGDDTIHEGDAVFFVSKYYAGQFMCPLIQVKYPGVTSLSTDAKVPSNWYIKLC